MPLATQTASTSKTKAVMTPFITSDPQIMGGEPVITGTRTPIEVILYRLKEGNSIAAIYAMYPWIDEQTLSGAIEEAIQAITTTLGGF